MPRPRKPPQIKPPKEEQLHKAVIQYLHATLHPDVIFYHCPNGGSRNVIEAKKLKAMGTLSGTPDITLHWGIFDAQENIEASRTAFIELKRDSKQKLSETQQKFRERCYHIGLSHQTCASIQEVMNIIGLWRVPTKAGRDVT